MRMIFATSIDAAENDDDAKRFINLGALDDINAKFRAGRIMPGRIIKKHKSQFRQDDE